MDGLFLLLIFGGLFALIILPQQRQIKRHRALVASLEAGDEVVTSGGLYGRITEVRDDDIDLEVAPGIELRVARTSVAGRDDPPGPGDPDALDHPDGSTGP